MIWRKEGFNLIEVDQVRDCIVDIHKSMGP